MKLEQLLNYKHDKNIKNKIKIQKQKKKVVA